MRVLFLTHRLPYAPNRGDRIRAYWLMREMSRFATVSLFSFVHDEAEEGRQADVPFAADVTCARVPRVRSLLRAAAALPGRRPLTHALLDAPGVDATLARLARRVQPDVALAFCSGMARFTTLGPLAGLPGVLDMVDVDSAKWADLAARARGPRRAIYRREARTLGAFEAAAARHARTTLVVNEKEQRALRALAPDADVRIVENGIDVGAFAPAGEPAREPIVVFCGVMRYAPNAEGVRWFAGEVWPRVRAARPDARFVIVGTDPPAAIRALARRDPSIEVTGTVPDVRPFLWRASVSVAPLHLARGLQNKVLEALAAGLPVVATVSVLAGLPAEAHAGVKATDDARAFADEVVRLLADTRARDEMRGAVDMRKLSWKSRLAPLEGVLRAAAIGV